MISPPEKEQFQPSEFGKVGAWVRKKIRHRLQGKPYSFDQEDFLNVTSFASILNWLLPKIGGKPWFRNWIEPRMAGKGGKRVQAKVVPLNAPIKKQENEVVPYQLMDEIMEKASFRVALHDCLCRKAMGCTHYPIDFGCLDIGEGARPIAERGVGRELTAEEAKAYVRRAGELGLVALAAWVPIEEKILGVPKDKHYQFLEFCFCCPCCCIGLRNLKYFSPETRTMFVNVGFIAKALPTCKGCFDCVSICPADAIKIKGDKVWVNEDDCIGCGLCQNVCPHKAIRLVQITPSRGGLLDYFDGLNLDVS